MSGQTISVDPRVLEGVQDFIPRSNMDTICQWQLGLWNRLVSEVNSEFLRLLDISFWSFPPAPDLAERLEQIIPDY